MRQIADEYVKMIKGLDIVLVNLCPRVGFS